MESKILKGFDGRYEITSNGEVFSLWKNVKNNKRFYQRKLVLPQSSGSKNLHVILFSQNQVVKPTLFSLMAEYFDIKKPDSYHRYIPHYLDGNNRNLSKDNLTYKIHTTTNWDYEPFCIYDEEGEIVEKLCACCGHIYEIHYFSLHKKSQTYRNECTYCKENRCSYKKSKKFKEYRENWYKKNKQYYQEYRKIWYEINKENLSDCYVRSANHRLFKNGVPDEVLEVLRIKMKIQIEIKNQN